MIKFLNYTTDFYKKISVEEFGSVNLQLDNFGNPFCGIKIEDYYEKFTNTLKRSTKHYINGIPFGISLLETNGSNFLLSCNVGDYANGFMCQNNYWSYWDLGNLNNFHYLIDDGKIIGFPNLDNENMDEILTMNNSIVSELMSMYKISDQMELLNLSYIDVGVIYGRNWSVEKKKNTIEVIWALQRKYLSDKRVITPEVDILKFYCYQNRLKQKISKENFINDNIKYVAGVCVSFDNLSGRIYAAVCIIDSTSNIVVEQKLSYIEISFPYAPEVFSFREVPIVKEVFEKLSFQPDLIICDGHGLAHPNEMGLATQLGIELDIPTIGCARNRLLGEYNNLKLENVRGSNQHLIWNNHTVGIALRTIDNELPVYVSIGHKVDLDNASKLILQYCKGSRIPESLIVTNQMLNNVMSNRLVLDLMSDEVINRKMFY